MSRVGLSAPNLLAVTGLWAAPFALYNVLLSSRVVSERMKSKHFIGDNLPAANAQTHCSALALRSRAHGNFLENVPLAFIFVAIAELNGGDRKWLNAVMAGLFAARLAHAEIGVLIEGQYGGGGIGRPIGYFGTQGVLLALAGYASYLTKGYWGF